MIKTFYLDVETIGFYGCIVLIQYAKEDGEVVIYDIWANPISRTLELIEDMVKCRVVAYNGVFDWFHIVKLYNVLKAYPKHKLLRGNLLDPRVYWEVESTNPSKYCLRPASFKDLMLYCQSGPYQYMMNRKPIIIRKVPRRNGEPLRALLAEQLDLPMDFTVKVFSREEKGKEPQPGEEFVDVKVSFKPSSKLDVIANDILGCGKVDIDMSVLPKPVEQGWKPYGGGWIDVFPEWYKFWTENLEYAKRDVELLQDLDRHFDYPEADYNDELVSCVANTRWKGFKVDLKVVEELREECHNSIVPLYFEEDCGAFEDEKGVTRFKYKKGEQVNVNSPKQVKAWITTGMSEVMASMVTSTNKKVLTKLSKQGNKKATDLLSQRQAKYDLGILDKLSCGRFHPSIKIIGSLSSRQSGTDGLNALGINKRLRRCFVMADPNDPDEKSFGGDFDAFEITLTVADCGDKGLEEEVRAGKKFTALLGSSVYNLDYAKILKTKDGDCYNCGADEELIETCEVCEGTGKSSLYDDSKTGTYAWLYMAQPRTVAASMKVDLDNVLMGLEDFNTRFKGVGDRTNNILDRFSALKQDEDFGPIYYREPQKYSETMLGFRRDFSNEVYLIKFLYDLAQSMPDELKDFEKVYRKKGRAQTTTGATLSAIYAAAFGLCSAMVRQAGNHVIQGTGAQLTKLLQVLLWSEQPVGIHEFFLRLFNVHDELQGVRNRSRCKPLKPKVDKYIEEKKELVPLLGMKFNDDTTHWEK